MRRRLTILLALLCAACSSSPQPREYLDDSTAVTVTVAGDGWIFARPRTSMAIHAQDYVTATPVQTNRNGRRTLYLYCHFWSTIDTLHRGTIVPTQAELALVVDDRRIAIPNAAPDLRQLGFGHEPVDSPNKYAELRVALVDADLLKYIADASDVRIAVTVDGLTDYLETWQPAKWAFTRFASQATAR